MRKERQEPHRQKTSETRASSGCPLLCNELNHFLCARFLSVLFHIFTDFIPLLFRAKVSLLSQLFASSPYMSVIYPGIEQTGIGATTTLDFVLDIWVLPNNGQGEEGALRQDLMV